MEKNKATSPEKKAALEAIRDEFKGIDCPTQRTRLLEALKRLHAVSTYEARRYLDIYYPPSRIKEMRDEGHPIRTDWLVIFTESGDEHRVGLYVLESEVDHELA
ncbi:MAG: helix-turn-helix domain-containing protein [Pseudomonadota bacterium]